MNKSLAVFGGTGRTGQHLIRQALESGFQVVALTRSPEKLSASQASPPNGLALVVGGISDPNAVARVIQDTGAVISLLGPSNNRPAFEICRGTQVILDAMHARGIRRLVISAGAGVSTPGDSPTGFDTIISFILKAAAANVYRDMQMTVDLVRASGLDWTVVRAPMLTDQPPKGSLRVGMLGHGVGSRISRPDLASFILKQVDSADFIRQSPVVSN